VISRSLVGVLALVLLAACRGERVAEAPATPAAPVTGARVETTTLSSLREAAEVVGTVRTKTQMLVASKVQGYVREVRVRQGGDDEKCRGRLGTLEKVACRSGLQGPSNIFFIGIH